MSKIMRRTLGIVLIVLVVLAVAGIVLRQYLTSKRVVDQVAARVKTMYKGDIELGSVDVGLGSTYLNNLKFFESASKTPWLELDELHMDISLLEYMHGNARPGKIKVTGRRCCCASPATASC